MRMLASSLSASSFLRFDNQMLLLFLEAIEIINTTTRDCLFFYLKKLQIGLDFTISTSTWTQRNGILL